MEWKTLLAYMTGTVDQELLLRNEYLVAENRILRHPKFRAECGSGRRTYHPGGTRHTPGETGPGGSAVGGHT